jgi:hypothetical protein
MQLSLLNFFVNLVGSFIIKNFSLNIMRKISADELGIYLQPCNGQKIIEDRYKDERKR